MKIYTPWELNAMAPEERKIALNGEFHRSFHRGAAEHVTWIFWTRETSAPTEVLGQGSAFILDRGSGPMLITAAHVYRQFLADAERHGPLYCQVSNTRVKNLSGLLVACGNLDTPLGEPEREPDIATFRMPTGAVLRVGKKPILAPSKEWPPPPKVGENVLFVGCPGLERLITGPNEMNFGFHSGMTGVTSITDHQIACRFEREFWIDAHGLGLPPLGYGLGGISGGPLLVPDYRDGAWGWRLGGVISQATEELPPEKVVFEMVVAHRAEYIQSDGTLAKLI